MNQLILFLMGLAAGAVGLLILGSATTALHEIEAFVALLGFAVLIGATGVCGEIATLRRQLRNGSKS